MDNLEKFVNDLLDGKLKAYLKSEPIPDSNDEPVKVRATSIVKLLKYHCSYLKCFQWSLLSATSYCIVVIYYFLL